VPTGWVAAYLVAGAVGTALASGVFARSWIPLTWTLFDVEAREATVLLALCSVALGGACHVLFSPSGVAGPPAAGRPLWVRVARVMGVCWSAALAAYVVGIGPLAARLAVTATGGEPDLLAVLSDLAAVMVWAPVGLLLATLCSSYWGVAVGAAALYATLVLPDYLSTSSMDDEPFSWLAAAPWWSNGFPEVGWQVSAQISAARFFLFALTAVVVAGVAALWLRRWTASFKPRSLAVLLVLAVPVVSAAGLTVIQPELVRPDSGGEVVCAPVGGAGSTVCVSREVSSVLGELRGLADTALIITGLAGEPVLVLGNGAVATSPDAGSFSRAVTAIAATTDGRYEYRWDVATQLARNLLGADSPECLQALLESGGFNTVPLLNEDSAVREVSKRVRGDQESSAPATGLEALTDDQLTRWVEELRAQLAVCAVSDSDMP
jgi:hypothetical protein